MKYLFILFLLFSSCMSETAKEINGMIVIEPNTKRQYMIQGSMDYCGFQIYELTKSVSGTDTIFTFKKIHK